LCLVIYFGVGYTRLFYFLFLEIKNKGFSIKILQRLQKFQKGAYLGYIIKLLLNNLCIKINIFKCIWSIGKSGFINKFIF